MFIAPLFIIAQIWKQPRCLSGDKQVNKQWYIQTMEYYSALKIELSYQAMKRHGGILNSYFQVKEANLKSLHTIWFQVYDVLEKAKLWKQ